MSDKPNFVLVTTQPEPEPEPGPPPPTLVDRVKAWAVALLSPGNSRALATADTSHRPRLVFGFDATASREPAWQMARTVTDALVRALPGELDVALAVHGGGLLHTFTAFTADANALRDRAAGIRCMAGQTRLLAILARSLREPGVRVVTYIGDVFEESLPRGQRLADELGARGVKLIVLHDTSDWAARRDAEVFLDLARRTGGCVLPFDLGAPDRLRDILAAAAVYAVGGEVMLREKQHEMPGAVLLLEHLRRK
ncbi:MAG: hypothetical protein ABSC95_00735 [Acetobacteraceae bacterium]|jgi:hypothetical protein